MSHFPIGKSFFPGIFLCLLSFAGKAQSIVSREYFAAHGNFSTVQVHITDDRYADLASGTGLNFRDKTAYGIVSVGFDPDLNLCYPQAGKYKITVQSSEKIISTPGSVGIQNNQYELIINYDPDLQTAETEQAFAVVPDARDLDLSIVSVKSIDAAGNETAVSAPNLLPGDIYIEGELLRERYFDFDPTLPTSVPAILNTPSGTVINYITEHNVHIVEWANVDGAAEYELEWTYVDDFMGPLLSNNKPDNQILVDFRHNASSVRVPRKAANRFFIPSVYSRGYVVFRVRAVGRGGPGLDEDIFGNWSLSDVNYLTAIAPNQQRSSPLISQMAGVNGYNNVNNQYSIQFAEDGKLLASGTFADGTLRVRQSVTAIKVDEEEAYGKKALIAETIYDHLGRAAISTLPAVTKNGLWYTPDYNMNTNGQKYSYLDFDTDDHLTGTCITGAGPMGTSSGSSQYYSSANPLKTEDFQGLIADAREYPFVQTVFERDNSGKPKVQGGVGDRHNMGSGHETKYIYGGAEPVQLNRLFGTDAGYAEYYQKNLILDPNGQISVTYTDMAGRTVATALAGKVPDNMQPLTDANGTPLAESGSPIEDDLLNLSQNHPNGSANVLSPDGRSFTLAKHLLIDKQQEYRFTYGALLADFEDSCFTFCLDCVYDLELALTDECGNYLIGNANLNGPLRMTVPGAAVDTLCDDSTQLSLPEFVLTLDPGSYSVYKKLSVNESAMNAYVDLMLENSLCLLSPEDFYEAPDTSGCAVSCESCLENIGSWEDFFTAEKIQDLFNNDATLAYETLWPVYNAMKAECDAICAEPAPHDFCEGLYRLLLADVSPGGQYAEFDDNAGNIDASAYPLSLLNANNVLPKKKLGLFYVLPPASSAVINSILNTVPTWRKPVYFDKDNATEPYKAGYYDNLGQREKVYIQRDANDNFYPPVLDNNQVVTVDVALNQYYTYHENLANLADFLDRRPVNLGKSLVIYHPEFVPYSYCASVYPYTETVSGDVVNSFGFDGKLAEMNYVQATALLGSNSTLADLFNDLVAADPFFANHPLATVAYAPFPDLSPRTMLWYRFQNFQTLVVPTDIARVAYIQNTCGYNYPGGCGTLPSTVWGGLIHDDATWKTFANYYVSAKQEVLLQAMQLYGIFGSTPPTPSTWNSVLNGCIGNDTYFPAYDLTVSPGNPIVENPCTFPVFILYQQKVKRIGSTQSAVAEGFGLSDPPTADELEQYATQGYYNQTGRCPMLSDLEFLLGKLTLDRQTPGGAPKLTASPVNLSTGGYLGSSLYEHINAAGDVIYTSNVTGSTMNGYAAGLGCDLFKLTLPAAALTAGYDFDDIQSLFGIHAVGSAGSDYSFTVKAIFYDPLIHALPETLDVSGLTCLPLTGCEDSFRAVCKTTPVAKDLMNLMSYLSLDGQLFSTSPYTLGSTPGTSSTYSALLTPRLKQYLGAGGTYGWQYFSTPAPGRFELSGGSNLVTLTLSAPMGLSTGNTYQFIRIAGAATSNPGNAVFSDFTLSATEVDPGNYFPPQAGAPGTPVYGMTGQISVTGISQTFPVTECEPLRPLQCNTQEHQNLYELEDLLDYMGQGIPLTETQRACLTELVSSDPSFDPADIREVISLEADMSLSPNGINSDYFRAVLKMADSSYDTLTGKYCHPMRNCITCEDSAVCEGMSYAVRFPACYSPVKDEKYSLQSECFSILPGEFIYDGSYATPTDFWQAYGNAIETSMNGVSAEVINGTLYLHITDPELLSACPCDQPGNELSLSSSSNPGTISTFPVSCCGPQETLCGEGGTRMTFTFSGFTPSEGQSFLLVPNNLAFEECYGLITDRFAYAHSSLPAYIADWAQTINSSYEGLAGIVHATADGQTLTLYFPTSGYCSCPCSSLAEWGVTLELYNADNALVQTASGTVACCPSSESRSGMPLTRNEKTGKRSAGSRASEEEEGGWEPWETYTPDADCHPDVFPFPQDPLPGNDCVRYLLETAQANAEYQYQQYLDGIREQYRQLYIANCMGPVRETFTRAYEDGQYHYTLYYYDRAGNLVKTVPPHAVVPLTGTDLAAVNDARDNGTVIVPDHNKPSVPAAFRLSTRYRFNSLNQPIEQITPDGGKSTFYYDPLGRVALSQNAKQAAQSLTENIYSYTLYDLLGRITEVGQMRHGSSATRALIYYRPDNYTFFNGSSYSTEEATRTVYDAPASVTFPAGFSQNNLRSRVSYVQTQPKGSPYFSFGSYYDYDIHGNVKSLIQENLLAPATPYEQNQIDYTYDLLSGKVKKVDYNKGRPDQFFHKYEYDDQNRLTRALTSPNGYKYDLDARYFYYWHGPLARTELGHNKVQGQDFAYTIQGWVKSVNSDGLQAGIDPGKDGQDNVGNPNRYFGQDAYGYSLHYYTGDYFAIDNTYEPSPALPAGYLYANLWNGNIGAMNNTLRTPNTYAVKPLLQRFGYDQLNRIARSEAYSNFDPGYNQWAVSPVPLREYATSYAYDPAGNLHCLTRNGNLTDSLEMDSLDYGYYPFTNQLRNVKDNADDAAYHNDLKDQSMYPNNYAYDETGNLIKDDKEEIDHIEWTVYGKVSRVTRRPGSSKPDLEFGYNAQGQRVMKTVIPPGGGTVHTYYYTHDAQGNQLALYDYYPDGANEKYVLKEQLLYGSSRLGIRKPGIDIYSYVPSSPEIHQVSRGEKRYELNDHLGNVHAVVSDRKKRVCESGTFKRYEADIQNAYDYYAFGMLMPGRSHAAADSLCADSVMHMLYNTDFNASPAAWASTEPGHTWYLYGSADSTRTAGGQLALHRVPSGSTLYVLGEGGVSGVTMDALPGGETYHYAFDMAPGDCGGPDSVVFTAIDWNSGNTYSVNASAGGGFSGSFPTVSGGQYVIAFQLFGNDTCTAYLDNFRLWTYRDTLLPCASAKYAEGYRYGFNGMEKIDEQYDMEGTAYDFGARMYDSRLGRWLSTDALANLNPGSSPYRYAKNSPLLFIDEGGNFDIRITQEAMDKYGITEQQVVRFTQVLNNLSTYLKEHPAVLQRIYEQTEKKEGQTPEDAKKKIMDDAEFGKGPILVLAFDTESQQSLGGARVSREDAENNEIHIDASLIVNFEKMNFANDDEKAAYYIAMAGMVLHEYTHLRDRQNNNGNITGQGEQNEGTSSSDNGVQGKESKYGHRGNDVEITMYGIVIPSIVNINGGVKNFNTDPKAVKEAQKYLKDMGRWEKAKEIFLKE